jgi:hypothetical protein
LAILQDIFPHFFAKIIRNFSAGSKYGTSAYVLFSVADPDLGSDAFLPPGSGMEQWSDPDPGSGDKQTKYINSLYTK